MLLNDLLMIYLITFIRAVISVKYGENVRACSGHWIFNARDKSIENIIIKGV